MTDPLVASPPINIIVHDVLSEKQRSRLISSIVKEKPVTVPVKSAPAKPGYQTTEFWVGIFATIATVAAAVQGSVPNRYAVYVGILATVAYQISRGLAKH